MSADKHKRKMEARKRKREGIEPAPETENINPIEAAQKSDAYGHNIGASVALELLRRGELAKLTKRPQVPDAPEGTMATAWRHGWKRGFDHVCIRKLTV